MDQKTLDSALLELRLVILELLVMRLHVAVVADRTKRSASEVRAALEAEIEQIATRLEQAVYASAPGRRASAEERALFADEYRAMLEAMKGRLRELFP